LTSASSNYKGAFSKKTRRTKFLACQAFLQKNTPFFKVQDIKHMFYILGFLNLTTLIA